MRLAELVAAIHEAFDAELAMADVRAICGHDRYQASAGIMAAAAYVADRAEAAGLTDVAVLSFPADGARRWWTYRAPRSWTPVRATLSVDGELVVSYPDQPYTLAAYSAATPPGGRSLRVVRYSAVRAGADPQGALVVADEPVSLGALAGPMAAAGAVAIAADPLSAVPYRSRDQVGRLELAPGSDLAAFSVTLAQLARLAGAADAGAPVQAEVQLDPTVSAMPVVTGRLPASGPGPGAGDRAEVLLSAHLCHPRPGANDNASGVAALLGIARALVTHRRRAAGDRTATAPRGGDETRAGRKPGTATAAEDETRTGRGVGTATATGASGATTAVRFVWGPEFVGTVAYLHDVVGAGQAPPPWLAINIDMAGQDVARCGGPLVLERGPDDIGSFLPALATRCATLLPPASRSYSGAVPCDPWTWRETPFAGGSDHALLADQPAGCQVLGLGHWPDRANHSSADTPDLVDPEELRRTAVIAAASVAAICGSDDPELAADVGQATVGWAAHHLLAVLPGRRLPGPSRTAGPVLNPHDELNASRWLRHRGAVALAALTALNDLAGVDADWLRSAQDWVTALIETTATRLPPGLANTGSTDSGRQSGDRTAPAELPEDARASQPPLVRCWEGPANLRALAGDACPADQQWLNERLAEDRGGNYARALAMMRGVSGQRDRTELAWWAALSSELPIPLSFAETFVDLMGRAGWIRTGSQEDQP